MNTLKTYEFTIPLEVNTKPKQPKKPEVLTEEIKYRIKLIKKAFR